MLNEIEFVAYCKRNGLSEAASDYVRCVREGPPSRRVGDSAQRNVCGRIPSKSIGATVQSESRTCEALFVFECELSRDVLEIWDQPEPIQLRRDKGSKGIHVASYTPDFLLLRKDRPALIECKTQAQLDECIAKRPSDWSFNSRTVRFLPATEAAERLGLLHEVFVVDDTASIRLANFEYLHALHLQEQPVDTTSLLGKAQAKLAVAPYTIIELCASIRGLHPAIIHRWLASSEVFGSFGAQLLSQPDVFRVFLNLADARSYEQDLLLSLRKSPEMGKTDIAALLSATPTELAHAAQLRKAYEEVLEGKRPPKRNEYRYTKRIRLAMSANGSLTAAFLPEFHKRGNRDPRLSKPQMGIVRQVIEEQVKNGRARTATEFHAYLDVECSKQQVEKISRDAAWYRFTNLPADLRAQATLGNRGYHNALHPVAAKHATLRSEIPGLIAHVDSTQFDTRLWAASPLSEFLECPWIYVIFDESCSRALGVWIGFGKSDRFALALAIRDVARRQGWLPAYIFGDRGAEYGSTWWEMLLAEEQITKYMRPPGAPRFGGIQESGLKQINFGFAHRLTGATWADQYGRSASGNKKSRATARLAFELVVGATHEYLFGEWNKVGHGTADASPDDLCTAGFEQFNNPGRLVSCDLSFAISTSIPVKATLGDRKGVRVAYREYWCDELNGLRRPLRLEECRLDPGCPSILYVKTNGRWFTTHSRDHNAVRTLTAEGQYLENYRLRRNAAANRVAQRASRERVTKRIEQLEISNEALRKIERPATVEPPQATAAAGKVVDLTQYPELPYLTSRYED